jgi:translocation and assembly module TamB
MGLVLVGGLCLILQTPMAKGWIAHSLSRRLSQGAMSIELEGLTGHLPHRPRLARLAIRDANGLWLEADNLQLDWHPRQWFRGWIDVEQLTVAKLQIHRRPRLQGSTASEPSTSVTSGVFPHFRVRHLNCPDVNIAPGILDRAYQLGLAGNVTSFTADTLLQGQMQITGDLIANGQLTLQQSSNGVLSGFGQVSDIQTQQIQLAQIQGDFTWHPNAASVSDTLRFKVEQLSYKQYQCDRLELVLQSDPQQISVTLTGQGNTDRPVATDIEFLIPKQDPSQAAIVRQCRVQWGHDSLDLRTPAMLTRKASGVHLDNWQWRGDPYQVSLSGDISPQQLDVQAQLAQLDLKQLPLMADTDLHGQLTANLQVTGSPLAPCIESEATIAQLNHQDPLYATLPPLNARVRGQLTNRQIQASLDLKSPDQDQVKLHWHAPVRFSLHPWAWEVRDQAQQLTAQIDSDISTLNGLPTLQESLLSGQLVGEFQHTGPWRSDGLTGHLQWINGSYEDVILGTLVRDIQVNCQIEHSRLNISQLTASAGQQGQINGQGHMQLSLDRDLPYEVSINTREFPWIQRPDVAVVASGDISLTGTLRQLKMKGQLKVDKGSVDLNALAPSPPPLLVIPVADRNVTGPNTTAAFALSGDIGLDLGQAFHISGRGLESLWQGKFNLSKQPGTWSVNGEMTALRGDYRLLGRPFRLERGTVHLDGGKSIDPILDIRTTHQRHGIHAMIDITGRASDPVLRISSEPAMPEDAVLAAVLFGKDLSTISPWQAVQLANTLRQLQHPGQGFDLFQRTRQLAGIDYLDIQKQDDQSQDLSLAVGKYMRPDVYVEVQRPLNNQGVTTTRVEYEVQPNLSVEADVGVGIRPGLQVNWKKDY